MKMHKAMFIQLALGLLIGGSLGAVLGYFGKCSTGTCPLTANPYRGAFLGALMGGVLAFSSGSSRVRPEGSKAGYDAVSIENAAEFESQVLGAQQPVLVDFYSNSCPPCRRLAPTIETLAEEYAGRAAVFKINVDRAPDLAQRYGIQGVPSVLFFSEGQETERLVGLRPRNAYTDVLDKLIG
jgi:thioredoxin 1